MLLLLAMAYFVIGNQHMGHHDACIISAGNMSSSGNMGNMSKPGNVSITGNMSRPGNVSSALNTSIIVAGNITTINVVISPGIIFTWSFVNEAVIVISSKCVSVVNYFKMSVLRIVATISSNAPTHCRPAIHIRLSLKYINILSVNSTNITKLNLVRTDCTSLGNSDACSLVGGRGNMTSTCAVSLM